jgi:hypothetical protein
MAKKYLFLIGAGTLNLIHGGTHLIQFIQSMLIINYASAPGHNHILHSPWLSLVWGIVGIITLIIGVKDYLHHRKCKRHESPF